MNSATLSTQELARGPRAAIRQPPRDGCNGTIRRCSFRAPITTLRQATGLRHFKKSGGSAEAALLASPKLEPLWRHSLEEADLGELITGCWPGVEGGEAYLSRPVARHGPLAMSTLTLYDSPRLAGPREGGCPVVYAETLLLQTDHAEPGGDLARHWNLRRRGQKPAGGIIAPRTAIHCWPTRSIRVSTGLMATKTACPSSD